MRFSFDTREVQGQLFVNPTEQVIKEEEANAALLLSLAFARKVPVAEVNGAIARMLRAEAAGPLLNPSAWLGKDTFRRHAANIDILRRFEDLRRALIEADELQEKARG